jgi:hypothetical protein
MPVFLCKDADLFGPSSTFVISLCFFSFFIVDWREMGRKWSSQRVLIESTVK